LKEYYNNFKRFLLKFTTSCSYCSHEFTQNDYPKTKWCHYCKPKTSKKRSNPKNWDICDNCVDQCITCNSYVCFNCGRFKGKSIYCDECEKHQCQDCTEDNDISEFMEKLNNGEENKYNTCKNCDKTEYHCFYCNDKTHQEDTLIQNSNIIKC
jgi:hypothetical protein